MVQDVDALEEDGIGAAEVVEFVLLLVPEHPLGVAAGEFNLGIADAIGGGLFAEVPVVLGAAELEEPVIVVKGEHLVGEPGTVEVTQGEVCVQVLGVGFQGAVVAFPRVVPAALVRPTEAILEIAFAARVARRTVEPVTSGKRKGKKGKERPQSVKAATSIRTGVRGGNGGRAAHGCKLTGLVMDFKQRLLLGAGGIREMRGVSGLATLLGKSSKSGHAGCSRRKVCEHGERVGG